MRQQVDFKEETMINVNNHILMGIRANQRMSRQDAQARVARIARDEGRNEECEQLRRVLQYTSGIHEICTRSGNYKVNCQRGEERVLGGGKNDEIIKELAASIIKILSDSEATEQETDGMKCVVEDFLSINMPPPICIRKTEEEQKKSVMEVEGAVSELGARVDKLEEKDQETFVELTQTATKKLNTMRAKRGEKKKLDKELKQLKEDIEEEKEVLERLKAVRVDKKEVSLWSDRNGMNGFGVQQIGNNNKTMIQSFTTVINSTINI